MVLHHGHLPAGVMASHMITHDLYPLPHSIEILEWCCPPSRSDVSQISEFQWDEDIGPFLNTVEMVFCSQHHVECKGWMNSMRLGSFRVNHTGTQSDSVDTYPWQHGAAKGSQLPPLPEEECLTWGDINTALTMGKECLQEDGAIFIDANIEGTGLINEPNSDGHPWS